MWDRGHKARSPRTAAVAAGQLGRDGGLLQEDEAVAREVGRLGTPVLAGRHAIRPVLFGGVQDFFYGQP